MMGRRKTTGSAGSQPDGQIPPLLSYTAAVLLAVVAHLARFPLHSPTMIPFITHAPFILLSAFQGGFGPGVLTTVLCSMESLYFATEPVQSFRLRHPHDLLGVGALALTGVVASAMFDRLQQAQRTAAEAQRVQSEMGRELDARRRTLESVIEHSPVSMALLRGRDFVFEMINPAYQAFAPAERIVGRTVAEVWPEAVTVLLPVLEQVRDTQRVFHATGMAIPRRRAPGSPPEERYFDVSCVPLPVALPTASVATAVQILVVASEVTEQHRAHRELEETLRELEAAVTEKTVLLKEVHHRVKNNLAVIVSLLSMKASAIEGVEAHAALEDSQRRVRSIALIHERLSGTDHLDRIDFAEYAGELLQELRSVYGGEAGRIAIRLDTEPIEIGIHRAVPCALILSELVVNSSSTHSRTSAAARFWLLCASLHRESWSCVSKTMVLASRRIPPPGVAGR